ncbi:MAG: acyl dehydratase, partial [Alphaproteobacteria bacterium]
AMMGVDDWRIHAPVKHGDTIDVVMTPTEKRLTSKGDRGIVTFRREIRNQRGEAVHTMTGASMYRCRQTT